MMDFDYSRLAFFPISAVSTQGHNTFYVISVEKTSWLKLSPIKKVMLGLEMRGNLVSPPPTHTLLNKVLPMLTLNSRYSC